MYGAVLIFVAAIVPGVILIIAGQISGSLLTVLNTALRMLLIFVLAPTMVASIYLSYRDVFAATPAAPSETDG
jgi:hypothetical protein